MFRLALISDVHADLHALTDALHQSEQMRCDAVVCAGDLVDYGMFPDETIALLVERRIPCVRGNHDRWAAQRRRPAESGGWELAPSSRAFLAGLPSVWTTSIEGVRVTVHHASPRDDMDGIIPHDTDAARAKGYLDGANADVLIVGHTHLCFDLTVDTRRIVNPGALLRDPPEGADNPPAPGTFGVLELPSRRFTVHRAGDGREVEILRRRLTS